MPLLLAVIQFGSSSLIYHLYLNININMNLKGIGYEVAKYFVNHGAYVILACRDQKRGKRAEKMLNDQLKSNAIFKGGKTEFMQCDLSKLDSTKQFIQDYKAKKYPLHLLINNAGLGGRDKMKFTKDQIDMIWQINYLSHFLITHELLPLIIQSSNDEKFDCRIINTSSMWHDKGFIDFDTLIADKQTQLKEFKSGQASYGRSKLAQILHATYMQTEVFTPLNIPITMVSVHPGGVRTNIFGQSKWRIHMKLLLTIMYPAWFYGMRNAEQGSRNTIFCSIAPVGTQTDRTWGGQLVAGAYHVNMQPHTTKDIKGQSTDPKSMKRLHQLSLDMLDLKKRSKQDYVRISNGDIDENKSLKDGMLILTEKEYLFYSIKDDEYQQMSELKEEQRCFDGPSIIFEDNTIYRIGGRNIKSDNTLKICEYLRLDSDINTEKRWVTMGGKLNERRCSGSAIFLNEHLLMIGGDDNGDELASIEEYNFDEMKWNLRASMNETRNDFGICTISHNELLVFGGHSAGDNGISGYLDTIESYNYELDKWTILNTKMPFGKRARCGAYHWKQYKPNTIVIAGGTKPNREIVEMLDLEKMKWIQLPNLNRCHWWPTLGTLSYHSPQILYVCGLNEENKLDTIEYLDIRQNVKKWNKQSITQNINDKITGMCFV